MNTPNMWAWAAGLDFLAAALHLAIIAGGPAWYRFFGAGEAMARMASRGHPWPTAVTLIIALGLSLFGAYAMNAGGHFTALPWPTTTMWAITGLFALRAGVPLLLAPFMASMRSPFALWSSAICAVYAAAHFGALR
jgi:hypothetical protein